MTVKKHSKKHNENQLRIRSRDERIKHAHGLKEAKKILDDLNIPFYLGGGTLLGAYRENDFVPWDWDVEVDFRYEDVKRKLEAIKSEFLKTGFELEGARTKKKNWKLKFKKYGTSYELIAWYKKGKLRLRRHKKMKNKFFKESTHITFYEEVFPCLGPIEEFLTHRYGDWQTRKRTAVKEEYRSPDFYWQKRRYFKKLKNIFKK